MEILSTLALKAPDTFKRATVIQTVRDPVAFYTPTPSYTGAIVITMPASPTATMVGMRLEGYEYALGTGPWSVIVGGYIYPTGNVWLEYAAHALQPKMPVGFNVSGVPTVRLGALVADGTKRVVILGDTNSVWQYPGLRVTEAQFTYSGWSQAWEAGWTVVGAVTDLSPYTNIVSIPLQGAFPTVAPPAIGTGAVGTATTLARSDHTHTSPTGMLTTATAFAGDVTGTSGAMAIAAGVVVDADVSASAAIAQSKIATLTTDLAARVLKSGDTMTGPLLLSASPTASLRFPSQDRQLYADANGLSVTNNSLSLFKPLAVGTPTTVDHAATKQYVDNKPADVGTPVWRWKVPYAEPASGEVRYDGGTTIWVNYTDLNGVPRYPELASWKAGDVLEIRTTAGLLFRATVTSTADNGLRFAVDFTLLYSGGNLYGDERVFIERVSGGGAQEIYVNGAEPTATGPIIWVDGASALPPMQVENFVSTGGGNITGNLGVSGQLAVGGASAFSGGISAGGLPITAVGAPSATTDAATKAYVDALRTYTDALLTATPSGFRNVIRNGDMSIAQRGDGSFTTTAGYTLDGWALAYVGGTVSVNRYAVAVGAGSQILTLSVSGQSTTGHYAMVRAVIEDVATLQGKQVTLSFNARSSSNGIKLAVECEQNFGTGGSPSTIVQTYAGQVTTAAIENRYSVTFTVPSISGKTLGTNKNHALQINFFLSAGTTFDSRTGSLGIQSGWTNITDVQLEAGAIATPFERRPIQQQLAWCQRYFQRVGASNQNSVLSTTNTRIGNGPVNAAGTGAQFLVSLLTTMRAAPTVTFSAVGTFSADNGNAAYVLTSVSAYGPWAGGCLVLAGWATALAVNGCASLTTGTGGYIDFSAEL